MFSAKWFVSVLLTLLLAFQGLFLDMAQAELAEKIIAVVDFRNASDDAKLDYLTKAIPESVITYLGKSGRIKIVERSRLQAALKEMELSMTDILDEQTAVEVGKVIGANAIMVGSFVKIEDVIRINARLIDVGTSRIIAAEQVQGRVGREIFDLMDRTAEAMQKKLLEGEKPVGIQPIPISEREERVRRPLYKRGWFWVIVALGIGGGIAATQVGGPAAEEVIPPPPPYPGE